MIKSIRLKYNIVSIQYKFMSLIFYPQILQTVILIKMSLESVKISIKYAVKLMPPFLQEQFTKFSEVTYQEDEYLQAQEQFNQIQRVNQKVFPESIYEVATKIPQRKNQIIRICDFIIRNQGGSSSPLYLYGNNGCGKTSSVNAILDYLQRSVNGKAKPVFNNAKTCYINCMSIKTINSVYGILLDKLFGVKVKSLKQNYQLTLDQLFCGQGPATLKAQKQDLTATKILIFDEIDQLIKQQKFIYNILEWSHLKNSKIIMIFISNMADLGSKLPQKHKSRMKLDSLIFKPYNYDQIKRIFLSKFPQSTNFLDSGAIAYICRKVALVNSDIRLLESIYRQVLSSDHKSKSQFISIQDVQNILSWKDPQIKMYLEPYKYFIRVLAKADEKTNFHAQLRKQMAKDGKKGLSSSQVIYGLVELSNMGFIDIQSQACKSYTFKYQQRSIKVHQKLRLHWMEYVQ